MGFIQVGKHISLAEKGTNVFKKLDAGCVYEIYYNRDTGLVNLEKISDSLTIPKKIYGVDESFIDNVCFNYTVNSTKKISVLLHGIQGTGKTISCHLIANKLNLPVVQIQVGSYYHIIAKVINQIKQPFILFIDEVEKVFENNSEAILSLLDDVTGSKSKFLTLLTANTLDISEYFFGRPSRIRYIKEFKCLNAALIQELVTDICTERNVSDVKQKAIYNVCLTINNPTIDCIKEFTIECCFNPYLTPEEITKTFNLTFKKELLASDDKQ